MTAKTKFPNLKQLDFCSRYLLSGNAAQAYRAVYKCSAASALASGSRLLSDPAVKLIIDGARETANEKVGLSAVWMAEWVKKVVEDPSGTHAGRVAALRLAGQLLGILGPKNAPEMTDGAARLADDDRAAVEAILKSITTPPGSTT